MGCCQHPDNGSLANVVAVFFATTDNSDGYAVVLFTKISMRNTMYFGFTAHNLTF